MTTIVICFLCGSQIGFLWWIMKLSRALILLHRQHEADMRMIKGITDSLADNDLKFATGQQKLVRFLEFLNKDEEQSTAE